MDRQFVEDPHQEVAEYDTLAGNLIPDEQRHLAWQRFVIKFAVLEHMNSLIEWLKIHPEYEASGE